MTRLPRHHRLTVLVALGVLASLAACSGGDELVGEQYISPLDGQTGWDPEQPLVAVAEDMDLPPDYPLPELIRVVDINRGGFVAGETIMAEGRVSFTPDEPFGEGRYGWVVDVPEGVPHGPELDFPELLQIESRFDTTDRLDVLGGSVESAGDTVNACVVLSRRTTPDDDDSWTLEVGGEPVTELVGALADPAEWAADLEFPEGDDGVDVICFTAPADNDPEEEPLVAAGDLVRFRWGAQEPITVEMSDGPILDVVQRLRRVTE